MKIALITGASSGMGREFVYRLDEQKEYDELWVIARRAGRLEELSAKCRAKVRPIALDLLKSESFETLKALLAEEKPEILTLVNAAGFGIFGAISDMTLEEQLEMIDLNDKALTAVTNLSLPYLPEGAQIYNICSLSSFQPVPYIAVYGASKAYALSFTRALNVELKKRKIRAMGVCPGWVKTEFFDRAVRDNTITYYNRYFTPEEVVARALRDMKRGKDVSVCGADIRFQVFLTKILPHRLVMKIWCRQQKK